MMINIVLYSENATINIAKKAYKYLSRQDLFRTTHDTIWTNSLYLKFSPNLITVNAYKSNSWSPQQLSNCLLYILEGEEVFISDGKQESSYIEKVTSSTNFDKLLAKNGI